MSIVCGLVSLVEDVRPPESWIKLFRREISRSGAGRLYEYRDDRAYLLKLDLEAFEGTGWLHEDGTCVAALAGDPIVPGRTAGRDRDEDLCRLSRGDQSDPISMLREARGNFSFARYFPEMDSFVVGTDRLGLRPVYWMQFGDYLVFSGVVRMLLKSTDVSLEPDMQGLMESVAFGFPFGDRTEYGGINILEGGDYLQIENGSVSKKSYWDWCSDTGATVDESPSLRRQLYDEFIRSIELRSSSASPVYTALSGGLDSRCVVGGLIELGREVAAINVSWPGSHDQILARTMADTLAIPYFEDELRNDEAGEGFFPRSVGLIKENHRPSLENRHLPRQLWGGNDGSISVGYVYVTSNAVSHLREGRVRNAAADFIALRGIGLSKRVFTTRHLQSTLNQPTESVVDILASMQRLDPGQNMFMFLLLTYQRKMMQRGLENIDQTCVERIEPFFDTTFLALTCRLPVDDCIGHGLFHRWLREFPTVISSVPWQAYPGHEQCPIELSKVAISQWDYYSNFVRRSQEQKVLSEFDRIARQQPVAPDVINWPTLRRMRIGHRLHLLNGSYAFQQANLVYNLLSPIA